MKRLAESPGIRKTLKRVLPKSFVQRLKNLRKMMQALGHLYREEGHLRNRRHVAIEEIAGYLVAAEIPGHYLEFGTAEGLTFSYAAREMSVPFSDMHFYAFDSFQGMPEIKGLDAQDGYTSAFAKGQFMCSEADFLKRLKRDGCPMKRIHTVKGWFHETLAPDNAKHIGIDKVAAAWIDCDLYESTVPVLDYLTDKLSVGAVIIFDDWRAYRNLPHLGQQRACQEWLQANPQIQLRELFSFAWHGLAFSVSSC